MYEYFTPAAAKLAVRSAAPPKSAKKRPFLKKGPLFKRFKFHLANFVSIVIR
jgi:hypothetical protein